MPLNGVRRARDIAIINFIIEGVDEEEDVTDDMIREKTLLGDRNERLPYYIPGLLVYPVRNLESFFPKSPFFTFFCGCWFYVMKWIDISFWSAFLYVIGSISYVVGASSALSPQNNDDGEQVYAISLSLIMI
jgi:hypothetical protein